ncbi:hypothetical protein SAMN04515647_3746 [Cohaesibacter sp. ES.047]|uniref:DUF6538 domain-containing protein n=1 Tax=Cohaesibacter sp. ES.047 TaxID=1798205 RepID=UPI000BB712D9|nr:DUF6538 domain-containing protein [Cohaesibacter sp. ES.047]SNY93452.1 hypothetical protein SAMN04515647_3746 [Cohaesibacter sp. ES.047]
MADYLQRRGRHYYYNRRVPKRLVEIEGATDIKLSLKTDSYDLAKSKAIAINSKIELRWDALLASRSGDAEEQWQAAQKLARSFGVTYVSADKLLEDEVSGLVRRLELIEQSGRIESKVVADALLGTADQPSLTLSKALSYFWDLSKTDTQGKSPNQVRKYKNPREKAFRNYIAIKGDQVLTSVTRADALDFRDWWADRIVNEGLTPNSANKDIGYLDIICNRVCDAKRLEWEKPFKGLKFRETEPLKTPPYSTEFLTANFFNRQSLSTLNEDQQLMFYMLIETGARPGEIINMKPEQIKLNHPIPHIEIRPSNGRELKTRNAVRSIPLVGISLWAAKQRPEGFPVYADREDAVSANINKYLREHQLRETPGHTVYSLRASFQDRLIALRHPELGQVPERVQADLMGHATNRPKYGQGETLETMQKYLSHMALCLPIWAK